MPASDPSSWSTSRVRVRREEPFMPSRKPGPATLDNESVIGMPPGVLFYRLIMNGSQITYDVVLFFMAEINLNLIDLDSNRNDKVHNLMT